MGLLPAVPAGTRDGLARRETVWRSERQFEGSPLDSAQQLEGRRRRGRYVEETIEKFVAMTRVVVERHELLDARGVGEGERMGI
jgi:hypothetical protein